MSLFIAPVLELLHDKLPGPAYSLLINILSHCLAFIQAVYSLSVPLLAKHPSEWNTQTFLPPFIALVTAYLALMSVYRTASWMLRTGVFFVKWGVLFGTLIAIAGYVMGSQQANNTSVISGRLWGLALDVINGGASEQRTSQTKRNLPKRPRVWESFDQHRAWNQDRNQPQSNGQIDASAIISSITEWWDRAKEITAEPGLSDEGKAGKGKTSVSR
ncbi:hypothetical protein BDZ89DRAFT_1061351 [Hymenopellis radicata]|nr:hypothetical protein BDZ89DRAFT_1061351 [Hymenopellis radicata]